VWQKGGCDAVCPAAVSADQLEDEPSDSMQWLVGGQRIKIGRAGRFAFGPAKLQQPLWKAIPRISTVEAGLNILPTVRRVLALDQLSRPMRIA
jgi:hypothetical protein